MNEQVTERIVAYVRQYAQVEDNGKPPASWSLETLDSMEIFDLVCFLESSFGIRISDREMRPENFGTIGALSVLVERKTGTAG